MCVVSVTTNSTLSRLRQLAKIKCRWKGVSIEPLWESIELPTDLLQELSWVIVGGESGPGANSTHLNWIRDIVAQCEQWAVPVFVKQLGVRAKGPWGVSPTPMGNGSRGWILKDSKGEDWNEFPADLRIRQVPNFANSVVKVHQQKAM